MTSAMRPEFKSASRRALLAGALGGIGAWAASAIGRASPAQAEGEAIVVGGEYNDATSATSISNETNANTVFQGSSRTGTAVLGDSGFGVGVRGISIHAVGVEGTSESAVGVMGTSEPPDQAATVGQSMGGGTGVLGHSGFGGPLPPAKPATGVYGYGASTGVWGESPSGIGVRGESPDGIAVQGESSSGWAGYFDGNVSTNQFLELAEIGDPSAPNGSHARLFIRSNGSGKKTQLCVRFPTGKVQVIATEP